MNLKPPPRTDDISEIRRWQEDLYEFLKHPVFHTMEIGDVPSGDYVQIKNIGDLNFNGAAGFYPRRVSQDGQPAAGTGSTQIDTGEMIFWTDTNDSDKLYVMYNDGSNIFKIELT